MPEIIGRREGKLKRQESGKFMQIKGVSFGFMARSGYYTSPAGKAEIRKICDLGATHVALIVEMMQDTWFSTHMYADYEFTAGDLELVETIREFHAAGVQIMLKPMIECHDSIWRGRIAFPPPQEMILGRSTNYAAEWFQNYTRAISHYAVLAESAGVEIFCIGCELHGLEPEEEYWPGVIQAVRRVYSGSVIYNAEQYRPGTPFIRDWFHALDWLGVSFYTGTSRKNPSGEEIAADLKPMVEAFEQLADRFGKPVLFAECGARSVENGAFEPWKSELQGGYDGRIQAAYLEGVIRAFSGCSWWKGLFWWKWEEQQSRPQYAVADGDTGFTIAGKPAEQVMRQWCKAETQQAGRLPGAE